MRQWGTYVYGSPLYAHLVEVIAEDAELLRVMGRIEHRPPPNLLFAAVQLLLLEGEEDELSAYYRSMTAHPLPPRGAGQPFRRFVLAHEDQIVEIGRTRYTQTNEVRRCAALLPAIWTSEASRFHLVDIGASAGLNLSLDRYRYRWGDVEWGPASPLVLEAAWRGAAPRPSPIEILSRTGLDLNPLDPSDPGDRAWLDALIWPEHVERRARLGVALELTGDVDITMVPGDALDTLPGVLGGLPRQDPAVLINAFTLLQFDPEAETRLEAIISEARNLRPVVWVSMEADAAQQGSAALTVGDGAGRKVVGRAHHHGEWIELF